MTRALIPGRNAAASPGGPVLLFDGECGLCQRIVRLLLRLDRGACLRFAALQSPVGQMYLRTHRLPAEDFDSLVFVPDWSRREQPEYLLRTAGAVAALRATGGRGARVLAWLLAALPERLRDAAYRGVARSRHWFFGPWQERPLGNAEWEKRFLAESRDDAGPTG